MENYNFMLPAVFGIIVSIMSFFIKRLIDENSKNTADISNIKMDVLIERQKVEYLRKEFDKLSNMFDMYKEKILKCKSCNA